MALPSSFPISVSQINVELGRASTAPFDIQGSAERALAGVPSGPISMSNFLGKSSYTALSMSFVNSYVISSTSATTISQGVSFGAADPNRRIFVAVSWGSSSKTFASSATIGGVAATIHNSREVNGGGILVGGGAVISAAVPTGTSGTVAITMSGGGNVKVGFGVYRAISYHGQDEIFGGQALADEGGGSTHNVMTIAAGGGYVITAGCGSAGVSVVCTGYNYVDLSGLGAITSGLVYSSGADIDVSISGHAGVDQNGQVGGVMVSVH